MKIATIAAASLVALSACGEKSSSEAPPIQTATASPPAPVAVATPRPKSSDGPFGVRMGMSRSDLEAIVGRLEAPTSALMHRSAKAPIPHDFFTGYSYMIADGIGVCAVRAASSAIYSNGFGEQIIAAFEKIAEPLTQKYGKPKEIENAVRRGSVWTKPEDWMMGLATKERKLSFLWLNDENLKKQNAVPLPNDIYGIILQAVPLDSSTAIITVDYSFDNNADCVDAAAKKSNKSL